MTDRRFKKVIKDAYLERERAHDAPRFPALWSLANRQYESTSPRSWTPRLAPLGAFAVIAVLTVTVFFLYRGRGPAVDPDSTRALMTSLESSVYWQAPTDVFLGHNDSELLNTLPHLLGPDVMYNVLDAELKL